MDKDDKQPTDAENQENPQEETQEEQKVEEDSTDWKAEALKYKAIAERKERKINKITKDGEIEKPAEGEDVNKLIPQEGLSREEAIFFAKGFNEDDLKAAKKIAAVEDISLLEAIEDDVFKGRLEKIEEKQKAKKAQLPPAKGGSVDTKKPVEEMDETEHREEIEKAVAKGLSGG